MMVIFQCFGGTHTSAAAAAIYLGKLPRKRRPRLEELLALPYFDRNENSGVGTLNFAGYDPRGNPVFILGSGPWGAEVRGLTASLLKLAGAAAPAVAMIDCIPLLSPTIRLGGYISRRLGLIALGRPLVGSGILRSYPHFLTLVENFEQDPAAYLLK